MQTLSREAERMTFVFQVDDESTFIQHLIGREGTSGVSGEV
jgi:hypothetical protein